MTTIENTAIENPPTITIDETALAKRKETRVFKNLQKILAEIRKTNGIIGFILKNSTQAVADINKAEELAEFAMLASQLFDSSKKLFKHFEVSIVEYEILEGSRMQILCLSIGGNQLSVLMEKSIDYCKVLNRVLSTKDD